MRAIVLTRPQLSFSVDRTGLLSRTNIGVLEGGMGGGGQHRRCILLVDADGHPEVAGRHTTLESVLAHRASPPHPSSARRAGTSLGGPGDMPGDVPRARPEEADYLARVAPARTARWRT